MGYEQEPSHSGKTQRISAEEQARRHQNIQQQLKVERRILGLPPRDDDPFRGPDDADEYDAALHEFRAKQRVMRGEPLSPWQEGYRDIWADEPQRVQPRQTGPAAGTRQPTAEPPADRQPRYYRSARQTEPSEAMSSDREAQLLRRIDQLQRQVAYLTGIVETR